jgi:hypothetical protein
MTLNFATERYPHLVTVITDSDFAGDKVTRRSTSGGMVLWGGNVIVTWSRVQKTIALSSAEAELNALVIGIQEGLRIVHLLQELNIVAHLEASVDSSAAKAAAERLGVGKMKHYETRKLFVQQLIHEGLVVLHKIYTKANPSDVLTKNLTGPQLEQGLKLVTSIARCDRADEKTAV